jgi:hypothetical protein
MYYCHYNCISISIYVRLFAILIVDGYHAMCLSCSYLTDTAAATAADTAVDVHDIALLTLV